ncbi:hypothetical protein B0H16DRAFT_1529452 [Mycena metata]|uniref:Uncharacterized protein n=1 Tax=Mycena metata TaxID=1033252 RepID=A0AAD7JDQ0_9AGAR|nr:hypothetical protein B0H16DRAFT_1529452 [Mycena metata]
MMFSFHLIAFVCAALAAGNNVVATGAQSILQTPTGCPADDVCSCTGSWYGCDGLLDDSKYPCAEATFTAGACTAVPSVLVSKMSSVRFPTGWVCTFYNGPSCDYDQATNTCTLVAPGSPGLWKQGFNDQAKFFKCVRR